MCVGGQTQSWQLSGLTPAWNTVLTQVRSIETAALAHICTPQAQQQPQQVPGAPTGPGPFRDESPATGFACDGWCLLVTEMDRLLAALSFQLNFTAAFRFSTLYPFIPALTVHPWGTSAP